MSPEIAALVVAAIGRDGDLAGTGGMAGVGVEVPVVGPLSATGGLRAGGFADPSFGADARLGARLRLGDAGVLAPGVYAEAGAGLFPTLEPRVWGGADVGVPVGPVELRIGFAWQFLTSAQGAEIRLGVVSRRQPKPPTPVTVEAAPAPTIDPRMVWMPHPVCDFVPVADVAALTDVPPTTDVRVDAPGKISAQTSLDQAATVALVAEPSQGGVVIAATYGDVVRVGKVVLPVPESSALVLTAPEGPFEAEVTGGGRIIRLEGAVVDGYALWLRAEPPSLTRVRFELGSTALSFAARGEINRLALRRGEQIYEVRGGFSPEGDLDANRELARRRAEVVRDALVASGVPPAAVMVGEPVDPSSTNPEDDRVALIQPRAP